MSEPSYKAWHCTYDWRGGWGAYEEIECVVIAEIKDKALGMALMEYPETNAQDWSATEIPLDKMGVHHISSRSS